MLQLLVKTDEAQQTYKMLNTINYKSTPYFEVEKYYTDHLK